MRRWKITYSSTTGEVRLEPINGTVGMPKLGEIVIGKAPVETETSTSTAGDRPDDSK